MIPTIKKAHVYQVGRILIFVMIGIIILQVGLYLLMPPPTTAEGFYELFEKNVFLGLISLDFLYLINNALLIMIYFAISLYIFQFKPILALLALLIGSMGITSYYASNPAFEFYFLSQNFSSASAVELERLITNGELLLVNYKGTAFISYYILNAIALYIIGIAFFFEKGTSKSVAIVGLLSAFLMSVPSSFGMVGLVFSLLSLIPWVIFCLMVAHRFNLKIQQIRILQIKI